MYVCVPSTCPLSYFLESFVDPGLCRLSILSEEHVLVDFAGGFLSPLSLLLSSLPSSPEL